MDSQKTISQEGDGVRYEKRWKIFWIVCGICFLVGIICCGAAWGIGTTLDDIMHGFPEEMNGDQKLQNISSQISGTRMMMTGTMMTGTMMTGMMMTGMMMTGMMSRMTGMMMTKDVII